MCNPQASFTPESTSNAKVLTPGQVLVGVCTKIKGQSYQEFLAKAQEDLVEAKKKLDKADKAAAEGDRADAKAEDDVAADVAVAAGAVPTVDAAEMVTVASTGCTVNTATSTANVRPVVLSNTCPVYHNGCSGPSDTLSYQAQLTPCCQAHDW
jgi:Tfp pilus assembly major pilin PilA